jgi:hypothetical protein
MNRSSFLHACYTYKYWLIVTQFNDRRNIEGILKQQWNVQILTLARKSIMLRKKEKLSSGALNSSTSAPNTPQTPLPILIPPSSPSSNTTNSAPPTYTMLADNTESTPRFLRKKFFSKKPLPPSLSSTIALCETQYPLLRTLCTTDAEMREVFDKSLNTNKTLAQQDHEKIQIYLESPLLGSSCLTELILLLHKALHVTPQKYKTMQALGEFFKIITPSSEDKVFMMPDPESLSKGQIEKLKQLKNNFIEQLRHDTPLDEKKRKKEKDPLVLTINDYPDAIQTVLQYRIKAYRTQCDVLETEKCNYQACLRAYKDLSEKLSKNSSIRKNILTLHRLLHEYFSAFFPLTEPEKFLEFDIEKITPWLQKIIIIQGTSQLVFSKKIYEKNSSFRETITLHACLQRQHPFYQSYITILKNHQFLIPSRTEDDIFFLTQNTFTQLKWQYEQYSQDDPIIIPFEQYLEKILKNKMLKIEAEMLRFLKEQLLTTQDQQKAASVDPDKVEQLLSKHFQEKKAGLNLPMHVLIAWTDDADSNPFLSAYALTKTAISSLTPDISYENLTSQSQSSSYSSLPSSPSFPANLQQLDEPSHTSNIKPSPSMQSFLGEQQEKRQPTISRFRLMDLSYLKPPTISSRFHPRTRSEPGEPPQQQTPRPRKKERSISSIGVSYPCATPDERVTHTGSDRTSTDFFSPPPSLLLEKSPPRRTNSLPTPPPNETNTATTSKPPNSA